MMNCSIRVDQRFTRVRVNRSITMFAEWIINTKNKLEANMKPTFCMILFTSFVIASQSTVFALTYDSLMCSGGNISLRDIASDVVRKCGQPAYTNQREQKIVEGDDHRGDRIITTIIIDDWIFNLGPDRLQYRVLLRNGRVWKIESLDYGY
jgi:uncharacterized protein DUF2845